MKTIWSEMCDSKHCAKSQHERLQDEFINYRNNRFKKVISLKYKNINIKKLGDMLEVR